MVDINLIKQLREMTQAGFSDCKTALEKHNGNLEEAVKYLREKGIAKAAKKAGAIAAEGATLVAAEGNNAIIVEINSQTDFVAKNDNFINLCEEIKTALLNSQVKTLEEAQTVKLTNGETIANNCETLTGKLGEKIVLRRFVRLTKANEQDFGCYQHANKRYSSLIVFDKKVDDQIKKNIAMHIVAMNPKFISDKQISKEWLENERAVITQQVVNSGKPKEFAGKIVEGKLHKSLTEVCLYDQEYEFLAGKKIIDIVKQYNFEVVYFTRYEVGEGIEKKETNFAAEVAAQMGDNK